VAAFVRTRSHRFGAACQPENACSPKAQRPSHRWLSLWTPSTGSPLAERRGMGSWPGVNIVLAHAARRGTMSRLIPPCGSKLCADADAICKCVISLPVRSFRPGGGRSEFPVDGKAFLRWSCTFPGDRAAPHQPIAGSFAAQGVATDRGLPAGAPISKGLGSAIGSAHSGALTSQSDFLGRDPPGLRWIRTDVVFGPARPFERIHDCVPIRACGTRRYKNPNCQ
jgi:hypothetical protein